PDLYALQLAPDGRIYVCKDFNAYLDAIDSPNVVGLNCNYLFNDLNLDPNYQGITSGVGLPDFVASYFSTSSCNALSNQDVSAANSALIFPNPSSDYFAVTLPDDNSEIEVHDIAGSLVEKFSDVHETSFQLGSKYPAGIYFVSVKNKSDNFILKIMKTGK
ncbi:MAG: T9SS type A sorting domain-containing protein, partial [Chitinophagales bacterium]